MRHRPLQGQSIHRQQAPRQYALGGRQLSGQEMARERAAGLALHAYRSARRRLAIERLLRYAARQCLPSSPASPFPPTCFDNLYLRLHRALAQSTVLRKRGLNFWERKWEQQRDAAWHVWREYVASRQQRRGA